MKKLSLIALCAIFSMFFFVSCGSDDEDGVDTETADTQPDTGTTDPTDTTDTTDPTNSEDPADSDTPENPTDDPANPTEEPTDPTDAPTTDPTDAPTDPTSEPTDPTTDPTDPTNPEGGSDGNLNTGDTSGNQAASGATGAACNSDSDCTGTYSGSYGGESYDVEAFCLTAGDSYFPAPGGYCTFNCDSTDHQACDNAGGVYHGYNGWGDGYCFHKCTKPSDCRVGYRCSEKIHACLPDCATAGCETGTCDETDKVCL